MSENAAIGSPAQDGKTRLGLRDRIRLLRQRAVSTPAFHHWLRRMPFGRRFANARAADLMTIISGFVQSQVLSVCLKSGILDLLKQQPLPAPAIAARLDLPVRNLEPWLQSATALGILQKLDNGMFALGDHGAVVASDAGLQDMIRHHDVLYRDLLQAQQLLHTGHRDTELHTFWSYTGKHGVDSAEAKAYSQVMSSSQQMLADEIAASCRFSDFKTIVDIGGGTGRFLRAIGTRHPHLSLHLFDLPAVIAEAQEAMEKHGFSNRCIFHSGSFFDDEVPRDHDLYCLIRVLFDHQDDSVIRLLSNVRKAMQPGAKLMIAEPMAGTSKAEQISAAYFSVYLFAMGGGRCRTPCEINDLTKLAGFKRLRLIKTSNPMLLTVLEVQA
ncbi:demethylspheroidene O-methyltransferase [Roseibium hamelinense]|uniref:Demethylspheroidene O-methyltransferase n=1 Tax=Roseibium hamelinense TaxID=150831 RepID=A0A562SZ15_9HYPH|nr:methyltransferase [Roseibium hamelinense]MTI44840.1 methyltransferase [Roseibium hamelinense]TWI85966.1 demethylspheroidene O-methyltransferase [Roseibium hamelinense]